jgi:hypothetical protein
MTTMIERLATYARPILDFPLIQTIRRNHALEHATIHILSRKIKGLAMSGRSNANGFVLVGDAPTEQIEAAAREALSRLKRGEHNLAVHPNCGTNLITAGALTTLVAFIGTWGGTRRLTLNRLSWILTWMMVAVLVSQPLGMSLQNHFTTEGEPGGLEIASITRSEIQLPFPALPRIVLHHIATTTLAAERTV